MDKDRLKQLIKTSAARDRLRELIRQVEGVDKKINDLLNLESRERLQVEKTLKPKELMIQVQELETQRNMIIKKIRESSGYQAPPPNYFKEIEAYF